MKSSFDCSLPTLALTWGVLVVCLPGQDWPGFRGPTGDGVAPEQTRALPDEWSAEENVRWRTPLPMPANGSPIVSGGCVFLTVPEAKGGKKRSLYCLDRRTGRMLWSRSVDHDQVMPTHETNPYCGTTPAADGRRVVVWHASAGLHCYDFDGERLWHRDLGEFRHMWGYGTSPVIHGEHVILHTGPGRKIFVVCLSLRDGTTVWKTDEPLDGNGEKNAAGRLVGSWCTPLITEVGGATQILCAMPTRLVAYAPDDGRILWSCSGLSCKNGDLAYSSPSIAGDVCLVLGGFEGPELGIRLKDNAGDVTETRRLWRRQRRPSNCGSGVVVGGYLFIPDMRGLVSCVNPATGERVWSERLGRGAIWSSVLYAGGNLYATNQGGSTFVFEPNPKKLVVLAENKLGEKTNSTPAISDGEIFLRTHESVFCVSTAASPAKTGGTKKDSARRDFAR